MKLTRVKDTKKIGFSDLDISIVDADNSVQRVVITDKKGNILEVSGQYGLQVLTKAPPEKKKVYVLSGKLLGLVDINETFDYHPDAIEKKGKYELESHDNCELKIEEKEVEVIE